MNNKKIYYLLLIFVFLFVITLIFNTYRTERDKSRLAKKNTNQETIVTIEPEDLVNPCQDLDEKKCFAQLTDCYEADSVSSFMKKIGIKEFYIENWPDKYTGEVTPPIQINFSQAKIFTTIQPMGGGDHATIPFIKLDNTYCKLTENNAKIVFGPIQNKEDALEYYMFLRKDIASAYGANIFYILKKEDYKNSRVDGNDGICPDNYKQTLNKVSTLSNADDGYLLNLITFTYIYRTEFRESQMKVKFDGTIEEVSQKQLLDCGGGAVF